MDIDKTEPDGGASRLHAELGRKLAFPLQQKARLSITWTPAQHTVVFFLLGRRPCDLEIRPVVNGVPFEDSDVQVLYVPPNVI